LSQDAEGCLHDWGGFLRVKLYEEALIFRNGGEAACIHRLPVIRGNIVLGYHNASIHSPNVGFVVTSLPDDARTYDPHLQSLPSPIPLSGLQWINIHHSTMQMITLTNTAPVSTI
jgi:hypothetical protein